MMDSPGRATLALSLGLTALAPAVARPPGGAGTWSAPQQDQAEQVAARVTSIVDSRGIVIDRGRGDGLRVGDRVTFNVRGGDQELGTIVELEGRNAIVRANDPSYRPTAGTRATIIVPASRFEAAPDADRPKVPVPVTDDTPEATDDAPVTGDPQESPWTRGPDDWTMDMPLLAEVAAVLPRERGTTITGRAYTSWDRIIDTEPGRGDSFFRTGGAAYGENLFGRGGRLHLDAEWNARRSQLPDALGLGVVDEDESDLRLDRLSYTYGGTRHDWTRWQFGRFLQDGMPELGVLDGAAWSRRRENGDSYGGSIGFMPEPDRDQQSLEDFQLAAWYRWVSDERERFSLTGGFQKTWHNGTRDRDVVIAKLEYVPIGGWNVFGSAWLDLYGVGDDVKSSGPGLTYAIFDARRESKGGTGIEFEYRHQEYPELLRSEYPPVGLQALDDAHVDRLSATLWRWNDPNALADNRRRIWLRLGGWVDEEDAGGDAEIGSDLHDFLYADGRATLATFYGRAKFTTHVGARLRFGRYGPARSWTAQYEVRLNDIQGFDNDNDNLIQHRIRGSYEFFRATGLSASLSAEYQRQELSNQTFLGLFLQHAF